MATPDAPARWWYDDPDEVFWLEITDRDDLGVDLNHGLLPTSDVKPRSTTPERISEGPRTFPRHT